MGDKRVRQAMAMAVDRDQNAKVTYANSGKGVKYMTGMSDILVPKWMPDADVKALNPYLYDPNKAASILTDLGWIIQVRVERFHIRVGHPLGDEDVAHPRHVFDALAGVRVRHLGV